MNSEERKDMNRRYTAAQKLLVERNPELGQWVRKKTILRNIILTYWIVHAVISILLLILLRSYAGIGLEICKLLIPTLLLYLFLNPQGSWKFGIWLYIAAAFNAVAAIQNCPVAMEVLSYGPEVAYSMGVPVYGLQCVLFIMDMLWPAVLLAAAVYLTVPGHKMLSEQYAAGLGLMFQQMANVSQSEEHE